VPALLTEDDTLSQPKARAKVATPPSTFPPPASGEVEPQDDGSKVFVLNGRRYDAFKTGLLARMGCDEAHWLPLAWSDVDIVPLNVTPTHTSRFIDFAFMMIDRYDRPADYDPSEPTPAHPGEYLEHAYSLAAILLDPSAAPPFPAVALETWQIKGLLTTLQVLVRALAPDTDSSEAAEARRDGPFDGRFLQWQGKRHKIKTTAAYRLLDYMWDRDNVEIEELDGVVFESDFSSSSIRARCSEVNKALEKAGLPWRLGSRGGSHIYKKFTVDELLVKTSKKTSD
jgi:hypothetical protein